MSTSSDAAASPSGVPSVATIARHYDNLDFFYRDIWGEHIHHGLWVSGRESPREAAEQMSRRVLARLELAAGARVVDVGCGYGGTARMAAELYGAHVTGFTVSAAQKHYADRQTVARGSVEVRLQGWEDAVLAEGSCDAVVSLESIEHLPDRARFAGQARRVLRPGGRMVVSTWLVADALSPWSRRHLLEPIAREGRQAPLITAPALRRVLTAAGFADVQVEDLSAAVARTWPVVIRRMLLRVLTRPRYWRFLCDSQAGDRIFALTACRLWAAYRTGAMRYALFVCR
jgi:cyclopropane fatty-acyl-phospholipid synthase-like methyltransferase